MKRILFVVICILSGVCGLMSCSEDGNNYPFPSDITDIKATPGPGSITLSWTLPEDENLKYVEVNYTIPETGKVYRKQISTFASSLLVDNLLHRYGEIDFKIQTYNEGNTGGNVFTISAQAESALPTYSNPEVIPLNVSAMYTNAPFTTRPLSALIDGDVATFFHSQWQTPVALPHYIVIDLGKEFSAFSFKSTNSNRANDRSWKTLNVYGSTGYDPEAFFDGVKFVDGKSVDISKGGATLLASYTDLPGTVSTIYTSEIVQAKAPVRWVWFEVTETTDGIPYFALAELEIYKYTIMSPEDL